MCAFCTATNVRDLTQIGSGTTVYTDANITSLITFADKQVALDYPSGTSANVQELKSTLYTSYLMATSFKGIRKALKVEGLEIKGLTDKDLAANYLGRYEAVAGMASPKMINDPRRAGDKVLNPSPEPDSD